LLPKKPKKSKTKSIFKIFFLYLRGYFVTIDVSGFGKIIMDLLSTLFLARLKFAFTVGFHILFPTITIGLVTFLFILEVLWLRTNDEAYSRLFRLFSKIFGLSFGVGIVTGIPMSLQFGTNWGDFVLATTNVAGPLLAFEVLTAFFLEATFLGIMLFGWGKVSKKMHLFSTAMVMIGTGLSAYWILTLNAWMQNPVGVERIDSVFYVKDWAEILLSKTMFYHLVHMLSAAYLTAAFVALGVLSFYVLRKRDVGIALKGMKVALVWASIIAPLQFWMGHSHGVHTREVQPIKIAAMEGLWETQKEAPMVLFAVPDQENETNKYEVAIPGVASWYLTGSTGGEVQGLKSVSKEDRPFVPLVFYSFRIMVGIGILFILLAWIGLWRIRNKESMEHASGLHWIYILCSPLGFIAMLAGWIVTEVGRQPWVIQGFMRIKEAATMSHAPETLQHSLLAFMTVYFIIFVAYLVYIKQTIHKGLDEDMPTILEHKKKG
jgi:cytochrome d ubiquinol oxidase subunit I